MSEEIIKVLDYITEKLGVAIDWTAENALPYVEEILSKYTVYNIVKYSLGIAFGFLLLLAFAGFVRHIKKSKKKCEQTEKNNFWFWYSGSQKKAALDDDTVIVMFIVGGMLFIGGVAAIAANIGDVMKWSIIPEIALLEEIKYLVG